MRLSFRSWLIYFAFWFLYVLSYVAVFLARGETSFIAALRAALFNVLPAALLGIGVFRLCRIIPWSLQQRVWFFPAQLFLAAVYSISWYVAVISGLSLDLSVRRGVWSPVWFGDFALQWQLFSGLMIYGTIASIVYVLQIAQNLQLEKARAAQAEIRAAQAEALYAQAALSALRAQLNPHFLFNTLHSLMALVRYRPQHAEDGLEKLAEMLRYVLREKREPNGGVNLVALRDEWRFVQNYLDLEKLRLGERLIVESEIETAALDCLLPAFTLQPLVENSIKHGIAPRARPRIIRIIFRRDESNLNVKIADDGAGARLDKLEHAAGIGLRIVREQLQIHYGERMNFEIKTAPGEGFAVSLKLPAEIIETQPREQLKNDYSHVNN